MSAAVVSHVAGLGQVFAAMYHVAHQHMAGINPLCIVTVVKNL